MGAVRKRRETEEDSWEKKRKNKDGNSEEREIRRCERGRERGNQTLMDTDRRQGYWETERLDVNMMSSSSC